MSIRLRFLGVGAAQAIELGSSAGVIEFNEKPLLLIDCGPEIVATFLTTYRQLPNAVFITHLHMDHIGGLERLFYQAYFDLAMRGRVRLYVPAPLVPLLQSRVADYPEVIAEGGANFWDAFQLIPVSRGFWHGRIWFDVFPTRHHAPNTSFGVRLRGSLIWTGDTRPIPETLQHYAAQDELIAHDCSLVGNPSHTGIEDIEREYPVELRKRLLLYHYGSESDGAALEAWGYRVATPLQRFLLNPPCRDVLLTSESYD